MIEIQKVEAALIAQGIDSVIAGEVANSYLPSYHIIYAGEEEYTELGNSRAGGFPDLPNEAEWPVDNRGIGLYFVAQINLSDIKTTVIPYLPKEGILYFFVGQWDWQKNKVFYYNGPQSELKKATVNMNLFESEPLNAPAGACKIDFELVPTVNFSLDLFSKEKVDDFLNNRNSLFDDYSELIEEVIPYFKSKVGGHRKFYLNKVEELILSDSNLHEQICDSSKWHVLLHFETDFGGIDSFYWVDGRTLMYNVHEDSLKKLDFESVYSGIVEW